jgi:hypothetical protein
LSRFVGTDEEPLKGVPPFGTNALSRFVGTEEEPLKGVPPFGTKLRVFLPRQLYTEIIVGPPE